jgi:Transposase DDE domain
LETNDSLDELFDDGQKADRLPNEIQDLKVRQAKLQEALAQIEKMESQRRLDGIDNKKNPAQLPMNDVDSRILPNKEGGYAPNYTPMAVTETENGFIVGADVLIGNVEHTVMLEMVDAVQTDFQVQVSTVMADGAYATGPNLAEAEERGIELLSPIQIDLKQDDNPAYRDDLTKPVADADLDRLPINSRTKRFDRTAFVYDAEKDCYYCPAGKILTREGTVEKATISGVESERMNYRCHSCDSCPLAARCRIKDDSKTGRKVSHDEYQEVRERHTERMQDESAKERYKKRQHFGETQFAFIKRNLGFRRFLLRGQASVRVEWLWASTTFNVSKLIKMWPKLREESQIAPSMAN